jgi:hypothetical protein
MFWEPVAATLTGRRSWLLASALVFALMGDRIWWPAAVGVSEAVEPKSEGRHRE